MCFRSSPAPGKAAGLQLRVLHCCSENRHCETGRASFTSWDMQTSVSSYDTTRTRLPVRGAHASAERWKRCKECPSWVCGASSPPLNRQVHCLMSARDTTCLLIGLAYLLIEWVCTPACLYLGPALGLSTQGVLYKLCLYRPGRGRACNIPAVAGAGST